MTICARSGRCSSRRRGCFSGRSIGRASSASSISGSRRAPIPVSHGEQRRGWVVVACLGYSRAAPARWCSQTRHLICSGASPVACGRWARCHRRWSGIARPGSTRARGRPTAEFAALCGQLQLGWRLCEPADPQAKGAVERLQGYLETNFEPGRRFANERDYQLQLDAWFEKANAAHTPDAQRTPDRPAGDRARADGAHCPPFRISTAAG